MTSPTDVKKEINAHAWEREENEHYVEPEWCSQRLFDEERFEGIIYDPACGFGNIPKSAISAGFVTWAADIVDRGYLDGRPKSDFFYFDLPADNIVTNPPFNVADKFALHALRIARHKVAMIFPTARLNAAHWMRGTPLRRVWLMTPRPSMPPGHVIARGEKATGGKMDFCWLVWEKKYSGNAELHWLRREKR
jgi:hypothetical protein